MRIIGLFIGVDVQQDESIRQLPFAGQDAEWLWASFADLNERDPSGRETDTILIRGEEATRNAVRDALDQLCEIGSRQAVDLAVVHFSCHGTRDGHLLLSDAENGREPETGLAFSEVAARLSRLNADRVIASFDTCFAARAAASDLDESATEQQMQSLGRGNRAVLAAARVAEEAYESSRLGHGLLSYGLIQGLDGRSVVEHGEIPIARWLDHAVAVVKREAANEGVLQEPVLFLQQWEGRPAIPVYPPGRRVASLLARDEIHQVRGDISDLAVYGLSTDALEAISSRTRGEPLNDMQLRAVNAGTLAGRNVLVAAPTSSGKTLVGELATLAAWRRRRRAVVLLPSRALASEKWSEYRTAFGHLGISAVRSYGGVDDDDAALGTNHFDVAFLTYEKFLLLALTRRRLLDAIGTVVLDEVHLLSDPERGRSVELLLTLLRARQHAGQPLQVVALSAALGELNGLETWLDASLVREERRPVALREGVVSPSGRFRYWDSEVGREGIVQLFGAIPGREYREYDSGLFGRVAQALTRTIIKNDTTERVLLFRAHRPDTRRLAQNLGKDLSLARCEQPLAAVSGNTTGRDDSRATRELVGCLNHGLAFHISDLEQPEREAVESAFRDGSLRCLVATSGLAMGINTPATSVIIVDHERFNGPGNMREYEVAEYKNMAGRAGRWIPGNRPGRSFLIAADDRAADELFERYVRGNPEPLVSRLAELDHDDLVISLLASGGATTDSGLRSLAEETFAGFIHRKDHAWRSQLREESQRSVATLISDGFVSRTTDGKIQVTEMGRICGREGISVMSARAVVAAGHTLFNAQEQFDEMALISIAQVTSELDHVYTPVDGQDHEHWPVIVREKFLKERGILHSMLVREGEKSLARLKRFYAVVRWLQGAEIAVIEREFTAFYREWKRDEPTAGAIRQFVARTGHVLRPVGALLTLCFPESRDAIRQRVVDLQPRLEFGTGRDGAKLARYRLGLTRGELRQLQATGISDFEALYEALKAGQPAVMAIFGSIRGGDLMQLLERKRPAAERKKDADITAQMAIFDQVPAASDL